MQGILRDHDLRGHVWMALLFNKGMLPGTVLCNAKAVKSWFCRHDTDSAGDVFAMWRKVYGELRMHLGPGPGYLPRQVPGYIAKPQRQDATLISAGRAVNLRASPSTSLAAEPASAAGASPEAFSLPTENEDLQNVKVMQQTIELGTGRQYKAVMLPADHSQMPYEVTVGGGGYSVHKLLEAVAGSAERAQLLCVGKVGPVVDRIVLPGEVDPDPENDRELHGLLESTYGPILPSKKRRAQSQAAAVQMLRQELAQVAKNQAEMGPGLQEAVRTFSNAMQKLPTMLIRNPTMYALADPALDDAPLNLRASCIAGHPIYGTVLLSKIRLRPHEWNQPSVRWGSYTLALYEEWLDWQMVSRQFARQQGMPLVAGLPDRFQSNKLWRGLMPEDMLARLWTPGVVHDRTLLEQLGIAPAMQCEMVDTEHSRGFGATLEMQYLGSSDRFSVKSRAMPSETAARQDAALAALRHLDAHVRSIMLPTTSPQACRPAPLPPRFLPVLQPPELAVSILQTGAGDQPCPPKPAGSTVEFNYWLRVPSADNALLEAGSACKSTLKTGALAPELDALLDAVGVHGKARCQGLWRPEAWGKVSVEAELLDWKQPPAQGLARKLFKVPMAQQRYAFVLNIIKMHRAQSVVDLGCGDGKLLEYLLQQDVQLKMLVGVDHNKELLQKADRRVAGLQARWKQGSPSQSATRLPTAAQQAFGHLLGCAPEHFAAPAKPHASVVLANIVDRVENQGALQSLQGPDVATMVEVVEHMDPDILAQVGQAVLGRLKPRVLVVTTPNCEYNPVLQRLGSSLLCNGMRNSDHRFEWPRAVFQAWAEDLAGRFGYSVTFSGIGGAEEEQRVLQAPAWPRSEADVGSATQVAVFVHSG
ncbi:hypothetical protein CVIRNUC_003028 [Coccomyxa viridis]|uniref:Small RNA 2'-O-methyltransferase n=1 Tax=Coccomyxa viridis TaxID=1274662 RepID=A0AAV1HXV9_9CHLO|nr:hypothetical protein CVIRNUC_003028 [Coccomyxa viridis]